MKKLKRLWKEYLPYDFTNIGWGITTRTGSKAVLPVTRFFQVFGGKDFSLVFIKHSSPELMKNWRTDK